MIKRVNIDMDPIPNGYGVTDFLDVIKSPPVKHASPVTLHNLEPAEIGTVNGRYNLQFALFTTEWQDELHLALVFLKTCLKHRSL
jgi:hypothetical protein